MKQNVGVQRNLSLVSTIYIIVLFPLSLMLVNSKSSTPAMILGSIRKYKCCAWRKNNIQQLAEMAVVYVNC